MKSQGHDGQDGGSQRRVAEDGDLGVILARNVALQAQIETLTELAEKIAASVGLEAVEGLPVRQWIDRRKNARADEILVGLEAADPGMAASVQGLVDASRQRCAEPESWTGDQ
ncbi:hypothetical protein BH23VER1_BH23VER1_17220 [soil metagenome]